MRYISSWYFILLCRTFIYLHITSDSSQGMLWHVTSYYFISLCFTFIWLDTTFIPRQRMFGHLTSYYFVLPWVWHITPHYFIWVGLTLTLHHFTSCWRKGILQHGLQHTATYCNTPAGVRWQRGRVWECWQWAWVFASANWPAVWSKMK